jgi:hypothetical protein
MVGRITANQGNGMKWRVIVELTGIDGTVRSQEVSAGGSNTAECSAATVGLALADGVGACVDGRSDARGKMRILTSGSIAIMCPA